MTRHPATFGRFVRTAALAVGMVQAAAGGLVVLLVLAHSLATASQSGFDVPGWLWPLDAALSLVAVAGVWAAYRAGALDEGGRRRRR